MSTPTNTTFLTEQQQAHIDQMAEHYRQFAEAIERLNEGVGRYADSVAYIQQTFKVQRVQ